MFEKFPTTLKILIIILITVGCATTPSAPSYEENLNQRPALKNVEELDRECSWIRSETARMHSLSIASNNSQFALAFQAKARRNIAALESRAAIIGCRGAFSSQSNQESHKSNIQECIDACKANTNRSSEACFDACNR